MFFEGSLQDGISTAVQQAKKVVCFVTDGGDESQRWEGEFLADESLKAPLDDQAVVLRLMAGSEEAGFLEALFPIPKKPSVIVIQNGQLQEYIASGTSREEFIRRLCASFNAGPAPSQPSAAPASQSSNQRQEAAQSQTSQDDDALYGDVPAAAVPSAPSAPQDQSPERAQVLASEQAERQKAGEEARGADAKKHTGADDRRQEDRGAPGPSAEASQSSYAQQMRQRKLQASDERRRILDKIENDKVERKKREADERRARQLLSGNADAAHESGNQEASSSIPLSTNMPRGGGAQAADHCSLQVRLLDGSSLRRRFAGDQTLGQDVRRWVDAERTDGDAPYAFRVVLTPRPNAAVAPAREAEPLAALGLAPSATLILVPVRHASAFAATTAALSSHGAVARPVLGLFEYVYSAVWAVVGGLLGLFRGGGGGGGGGGSEAAGEEIPLETRAVGGGGAASNSRIRGFRNPEDRRDAQPLYNGNSLNFEPRRDEDEENT
ncbi:hypothetical protein GGR56DRAFT_692907 [Xylariaceae sp. FL0804]|nr:hypothetical protein GGR56DRAFT_692907 [Xylariaceae sp. FL0804]